MNIQRLSPPHASEYRALMLEAYALHPAAFVSSVAEREAMPLSWWEARLEEASQPDSLVLGGFQKQRLAGVAGLAFGTRLKERHKARLYGLYVSSACRRGGLGRQLIDAALAEARARSGIRVLQLTVTDTNRAALALYERAGFMRFGVEPFAFAVDGNFLSKVHMWYDLETAD